MTIGKPLPPRTALSQNSPLPHPGAAPATVKREPKTLTVGREITLSGEITSCDRLVVEGEVRSSLESCQSLEIARGGAFRGKAKITTAEIAGLFEGEIDVEDCLILRATGRIIGTIRYRDIEIERGGKIAGTMETIDDANTVRNEGAGPTARAPHVVA